MANERLPWSAALLCLLFASACATPPSRLVVSADLAAATKQGDALATSDALEALIERGAEASGDREYAYEMVCQQATDSAAGSFARAAVTGRLVQQRGLTGASLIGEVETFALRSRALDPGFRGGAATRLLGTLYVIAPGAFLAHGDSERGIELLEELVSEHPEVVENQLRLAEAYIALGDPDPAGLPLCVCLAHRDALRRDDQQLLDQLVETTGAPDCDKPG
jgi:hypothetical protein